jgi:hypothetical protein
MVRGAPRYTPESAVLSDSTNYMLKHVCRIDVANSSTNHSLRLLSRSLPNGTNVTDRSLRLSFMLDPADLTSCAELSHDGGTAPYERRSYRMLLTKRASAAACGCLLVATTGSTTMDAAPAGRGRRTECSYTAGGDCLTAAMTDEEYAACTTCYTQANDAAIAVIANATAASCAVNDAYYCAVIVACPCLWSCARELIDFFKCTLPDGMLNPGCETSCSVNGTTINVTSSGAEGNVSGGSGDGGGGSSGSSSSPTSRANGAAAVALFSALAAAGLASAN